MHNVSSSAAVDDASAAATAGCNDWLDAKSSSFILFNHAKYKGEQRGGGEPEKNNKRPIHRSPWKSPKLFVME
jgi:hypothetical protein